MSGSRPLGKIIGDLYTEWGGWIGANKKTIALVSSVSSLILVILNQFFGVQFTHYGDMLRGVVSSNSFISLLLVFVLVSQVLLFQRIAWVVDQLEPEEDENEEIQEMEGTTEEEKDLMTDGSGLPPRDGKGRFTSSDSGGSNFLLILLGGLAGYIMGAESAAIEPLAGVLIGIAAVLFLQIIAD